jgi:hypothetical protein
MLIAFETFCRYDKITKCLYTQFSSIRANLIVFCYSYRNQ